MRYVAAVTLNFTSSPDDPFAPLDVCAAGTELRLMPAESMSLEEDESLKRLKRNLPPDTRIMAFEWLGKVRFLRMGDQVRVTEATSAPVSRPSPKPTPPPVPAAAPIPVATGPKRIKR